MNKPASLVKSEESDISKVRIFNIKRDSDIIHTPSKTSLRIDVYAPERVIIDRARTIAASQRKSLRQVILELLRRYSVDPNLV